MLHLKVSQQISCLPLVEVVPHHSFEFSQIIESRVIFSDNKAIDSASLVAFVDQLGVIATRSDCHDGPIAETSINGAFRGDCDVLGIA